MIDRSLAARSQTRPTRRRTDGPYLLRAVQIQTLFLFFVAASLWGCLAIQEVPLEQAPFYQATISGLKKVVPSRAEAIAPIWAGAAKIALPLHPGIPLAGYGSRKGRGAEGTHDPLFTRALALKQGEKTVLLISNDLLVIPGELKEAVVQKIQKKIPVGSDAVMVAATHTHSGPGALAKKFLEQFAAGPFDPPFFDEITEAMANAALRAYAELQPARISYGVAAAPDLIQNRMIPSGPTDPEIRFVEFKNREGKTFATLVNFSAHATVLKPDNFYYSGDYPGFFEAALEEEGGVALFTAGSVADQTAHPLSASTSFDRAEGMGKRLAERVRESKRSPLPEEPLLSSAELSLHLPPPQVKVRSNRRLPFFIAKPFFDSKTAVQMIRIGPLLLLGVPADLSVELGEKIKEYAQGRGFQAIIIGFSNDYIGYLLPRRLYDTPSYEASMSFNGPQMGDYFLEISERLIDRITADRNGDPR